MFKKNKTLDEKYTYPNASIPNRTTVLFPQADTDFNPPLFFPTENWKGGSRSGFRHLKNAFQVLYSTMEDMGYAVNRKNTTHPDIIINWSGKHLGNHHRDKTLVMEHGWMLRLITLHSHSE
ncbi:MAG: hypothetical protein J7L53_02655 [Deltaproteobacteria bacterium]|nr:hypothetical protein [Deltaproteobacteria bacterium]